MFKLSGNLDVDQWTFVKGEVEACIGHQSPVSLISNRELYTNYGKSMFSSLFFCTSWSTPYSNENGIAVVIYYHI